jgi:hypothetical protein
MDDFQPFAPAQSQQACYVRRKVGKARFPAPRPEALLKIDEKKSKMRPVALFTFHQT